jgi:hypothetical protein
MVCLAALSGATGAQEMRFITEYRLDNDMIEIPFEYQHHQIILHGEADDKKDLTFLFDTGASRPTLEVALGLNGQHLGDTNFHEAEGVTNAESVWLSDLRIGDQSGMARVHNIPVLMTDLSQVSRVIGRRIDGIIGITFMAGYVVEIDYQKHLLRLYNCRKYTIGQRKPDNQRTFLFDLKQADPRAPVSIVFLGGQLHEKYDYDFLLDTGFGGYVSVALWEAQESGLFKQDTPRAPATNYSITRQFKSDKIRASYLMIGEINLSGRIIQVDYRNTQKYGQFGIAGNRFLQNYRITLDYQRHKLWMERMTEQEEPDEAERFVLGISVRAENRTVRVDKVMRHSPAHRAGVRPGDMIVAVNGKRLDELDTANATKLLTAPQGVTTLTGIHGVDPNFGTRGASYTLTLLPSSPFDWRADDSD